jgi:hypothetical protein
MRLSIRLGSSFYGLGTMAVSIAVAIFCLCGASGVNAQLTSAPVKQKSAIQQHLESLGSIVKLTDGRHQGSREILLRWTQAASGTQVQSAVRQPLQVVRQLSRKESVPMQRSAEIAYGQLLVTVSDAQGIIRFTTIMSDPRITLAEYADDNGKMHRNPDIVNNDVQLEVAVPASVDVSEIRAYKAVYSADGTFSLALVASTVVPGAAQ